MTLREAVDQMTPEKLEAWLESHCGAFACVDSNNCVLAEYLTEITECRTSVDGKRASQHWSIEVELPGWALDFIERFDSLGIGCERGVKSTLRILRECCPELSKASA